ncbi:hypothetical protein DZ08F32_34520 [Escherichia coli]
MIVLAVNMLYNYISLPDDFPVRNIAPQVKEVLKDFIDALSTIICNEEWVVTPTY